MTKKTWLNHRFDINLPVWTVVAPVLAIGLLSLLLLFHPAHGLIDAVTAVLLMASVFAAVHHAEVIAHRVGEPFGTLVLAVAVTLIEVALIVVLMSGSPIEDRAVLARDTVFAAVMLVFNGIIGLCLLIGGLRNFVQKYELEGINKAVGVLLTMSLIVFILPNFTESTGGGLMLHSQAIFIGISSFILYAAFIFTQTVRHRDYFIASEGEDNHLTDNMRTVVVSAVWLVLALVAVVGLAKMLSPLIEATVNDFGLPKIIIGIIIAALVLLPESVAAVKAAYNNRLQVSLNLALGSAMACIGLTIPTIVALTAFTGDPLVLGLTAKYSLMLIITLVVTSNTLRTGKTTFFSGVVHLVLLATFIFFSIVP